MTWQSKGLKFLIFTPLAVCSIGVVTVTTSVVASAEEKQPQLDPKVQAEVNDEVVYRKKTEAEADADVATARRAFTSNRYKESIDFYNSAVKRLQQAGSSKHVNGKIAAIKKNMAIVYHYWARSEAVQAQKEADAKRFGKAIKHCLNAMEMDPAMRPEMERLVKRYQEQQRVAVYKTDTSPETIDPTQPERLYKIDLLLAQGKKLYDEKLWHRAREKFESVLVMDPYNAEAILLIRNLTKEMYKAGVRRYHDTRMERNAETTWKYVAPLIPRSAAEAAEEKPMRKKQVSSKIQKKLNDIIIKHMEFEDMTIETVIKTLRIKAKQKDPEHQGVNIVLRLTEPGADGASSSEGGEESLDGDSGGEFLDDSADAGSGDTEDAGDAGDDTGGDALADDIGDATSAPASAQTLTLMFDNLSVGDAIKNICMAAGMKYRIEQYAVVIAAKDVPLDQLETRIYPINSEVATSWTSSDGGGGGEGDSGNVASVQAFFERNGVSFPEGAKIVYDSAISRIIATNVPAQLDRIERILKELDVTDPQVLIEAKFVEVRENKTNELGFGWTISRQNNGEIVPPATRPGTGMGTATGIDGTNFNRLHYSTSQRTATMNPNDQPLTFLNGAADPNDGNDRAFDIQHIDRRGINYRLTVHALDLEDNTNILSCPRITTLNNEEATIRMVKEVYFPDSWGDAQLVDTSVETAGIRQVAFVSSMPEFSEPTELGVSLTVTPAVDADKYTITLDLIPVVQAHVGWVDYSYDHLTSLGTVTNTLKMPIIEKRTVQTQVTIYDGETVVMGGIMRDTTSYIDDRVPILGDIPMVGRFFRSKSVNSAKANLLIFTTPRLVNPNGAPLRQREVRGKPPFRM